MPGNHGSSLWLTCMKVLVEAFLKIEYEIWTYSFSFWWTENFQQVSHLTGQTIDYLQVGIHEMLNSRPIYDIGKWGDQCFLHQWGYFMRRFGCYFDSFQDICCQWAWYWTMPICTSAMDSDSVFVQMPTGILHIKVKVPVYNILYTFLISVKYIAPYTKL